VHLMSHPVASSLHVCRYEPATCPLEQQHVHATLRFTHGLLTPQLLPPISRATWAPASRGSPNKVEHDYGQSYIEAVATQSCLL